MLPYCLGQAITPKFLVVWGPRLTAHQAKFLHGELKVRWAQVYSCDRSDVLRVTTHQHNMSVVSFVFFTFDMKFAYSKWQSLQKLGSEATKQSASKHDTAFFTVWQASTKHQWSNDAGQSDIPGQVPMGPCSSRTKYWGCTVAQRKCLNGST